MSEDPPKEYLTARITSGIELFDGPVKESMQLYIHDFSARVKGEVRRPGEAPLGPQLSSLDVRVNFIHNERLPDIVAAESLEVGRAVRLYPYLINRETGFIHAGALGVEYQGGFLFIASLYHQQRQR